MKCFHITDESHGSGGPLETASGVFVLHTRRLFIEDMSQ